MSTPRKRQPGKKKSARGTAWQLGPVPDDVLGSGSDAPPRPGPEAPPLAIDERFEHLIRNPDLYATVSATLTFRAPGSVGRPLSHPPYIYFIFLCAISVFGTARSTAAHLARPLWWGAVREAVRDLVGPHEADALKPTGPTRSQWNYYFKRYLKELVSLVRDASRDTWIQQAIDQGMMSADRPRGS